MLFPANLLNSIEKTKSKPGKTTTKIYNTPRLTQITKFTTMQIAMHQEQKNTITENKLKQLKTLALVASYDLLPGNRAGLFSKEKVSKKVDK